jgi:hypothetical protein
MINNGDHKVVRHKMGIVKLQTKNFDKLFKSKTKIITS